MNKRRSRVFSALGLVGLLVGSITVFLFRPPGAADASAFPSTRDAAAWPFAWNSIWNLPVGDQARLVPAGLPASRGMGLGVDENVIVLEPQARQTNISRNTAGWSWHSTRCGTVDGTVVASNVPIPTDFSTDPGYLGQTPNMAGAVLMADGATVLQTQPFHVCGNGGGHQPVGVPVGQPSERRWHPRRPRRQRHVVHRRRRPPRRAGPRRRHPPR
ncbi:MAG: hypothetical protein R2749_16710 [Acidimicrobiales bacterium]